MSTLGVDPNGHWAGKAQELFKRMETEKACLLMQIHWPMGKSPI